MPDDLNTESGVEYVKKRTRIKQEVQFLNVDLEVWSKQNLQILIDAFGENVLEMEHFRFDNGNVLASFELDYDAVESWDNIEPDEIIAAFCGLIEKFPRKARTAWDKSYQKVFDIGIDSGNTGSSYNTMIKPETLKRVEELGAGIVITVYPVPQHEYVRKDEAKTS